MDILPDNTRVRINPGGTYAYQIGETDYTPGIILKLTEIAYGAAWYEVEFLNGYRNIFRESHLVLDGPNVPKEITIFKGGERSEN